MIDMSAMFTRFSLNPAKKNALAYRTTSSATNAFPCIPHPFTRIDRTIDAKDGSRSGRYPLAREVGWKPAGADTPRGRTAANETRPEQARKTQKPASGKPLHIDCVSGTPENWRVRRGSANARLGHAYPWYVTYSSHIPASLRTFPQRKPPRCQRKPGADGARRSKGTPTRSQTKQPQADGESPGRKPRTGKRDPKRGP